MRRGGGGRAIKFFWPGAERGWGGNPPRAGQPEDQPSRWLGSVGLQIGDNADEHLTLPLPDWQSLIRYLPNSGTRPVDEIGTGPELVQ